MQTQPIRAGTGTSIKQQIKGATAAMTMTTMALES